MISHELRSLYVHVPKTGGLSIQRFFVNHLGIPWDNREELLLGPNDDPERGPNVLDHLKASEYIGRGHITREQFDSYFKFAFVRNPWDRAVSEYHYRGYAGRFGFKTFLFEYWPSEDWNDLYLHAIPQYDFIFDINGNQLVDYVGRFEELQSGFDEVCKRIGVNGITTLQHHNRSKPRRIGPRVILEWLTKPTRACRRVMNSRPHYTDYYDEDSKQFIENVYRKDIDAFDYSFGNT